jgi:hypothetical protein
MRSRGVKVLDPVLDHSQIDWLFVSVEDCPDAAAEARIITAYFRKPHGPWGPGRAFVSHVEIRRSRRRVLFRQRSGRGM